MKNLPLTMLRAFAAVYETGGVRPAARLLGITHSSVSRHLQELEAWIGSPLLKRPEGRRTIAFTPEGEALGRASLTALSELERSVTSVREAHQGNAVTIETTPSFAVRWLLPRLDRFAEAYTWIELSVVVDQRSKTASDIEADIAIRMGRGPWPGARCTPFMDDALVPVMNASYWRSAGRPEKVTGLTGLRLLHDRDPNASWAAWKKVHGPADLDIRRGSRFTSSDLVLRAAEQGLGVALARERLAGDSIAAGSLLAPFEGLSVPLPNAHWILRPDARQVRTAAQAVVDWLVNEAEQMDNQTDSPS